MLSRNFLREIETIKNFIKYIKAIEKVFFRKFKLSRNFLMKTEAIEKVFKENLSYRNFLYGIFKVISIEIFSN